VTLYADMPGSAVGERRPSSARPSLARPYTLTGGRTQAKMDLPLEAAVEALVRPAETDWAPGDVRTEIVDLCQHQPSMAEIAALVRLPIGVARVLVADLVETSYLRVSATLSDNSTMSERRALIERTLSGLRAL
jgi:hypothetical protein